ncbi:hypothetical protein Vadar_028521 [Vaccinium darrowii]|uniref:Uncharacterized protein n=1 Tax=Vaccinium darrowii TaxID=229202 RepID=A0ACB7XLC8_9ERIC|nr:hypothetical protein Vadar_028521 [Vaccinium darrowii]
MGLIPEVALGCPSGQTMPVIGFGTISHTAYPLADAETTKSAILEAIKAGYRHFDTAFAYRSEQPLGEAIAEALRLGLVESRDELFITTKLWMTFAASDQIVPAIKLSLKLTQHINKTPVPNDYVVPLDIKSVWEGMEECQNLGLAKGIGVNNFSCMKLEELLSVAKILPVINQVTTI